VTIYIAHGQILFYDSSMPIVPSFLQSTVNPILNKIHHSTPYVRRYNNTMGFRLNETYMRYARMCSSEYARKNGKQDFGISSLSTQSAERIKGIMPVNEAQRYSERISMLIENKDKIAGDEAGGHESLLKTIKHPPRTFIFIYRTSTCICRSMG